MIRQELDRHLPADGESRRKLFKLLAASPFLGLAASGLPASWQDALAREAERRAIPSAPLRCSGCGLELPPSPASPRLGQVPEGQARDIMREQVDGQMITSADDAFNVWDFERVTHANTLAEHWSYLHVGVDDFETRWANREGFTRLQMRARRLGPDADTPDLSVELFGTRYESPLFLCPVSSLEAYHTEGESGVARAAATHGVLQMQSHRSSQSYDAIAEARGGPHWYQIYTDPDFNLNKRVIERVESAGCQVLVWTLDMFGGSNREMHRRALHPEGYQGALCQQCHNHRPENERVMTKGLDGPRGETYPYDWDYVKRVKDATQMKLVLKGIVTAEEAELAVENGADGICVSNHGGRADNSGWATIDSLPEVVLAVRGRVPVLIDSGVRRGTDIFKALALGADAVGIGRPYVWGLGAFGEDGTAKVIELLHNELTFAMRQTRTASLDQITSRLIMKGPHPIMMRENRLGFGL